MRSASRMICSGGSSRVTYKACSPCSMPSIRNWIAKVDFPVPLEPRMTMVDLPETAFDQVVEPWDSARYFLDIRHGMVPLGPRPGCRGESLAGWNMALDAGGFLKQFRPRNLP